MSKFLQIFFIAPMFFISSVKSDPAEEEIMENDLISVNKDNSNESKATKSSNESKAGGSSSGSKATGSSTDRNTNKTKRSSAEEDSKDDQSDETPSDEDDSADLNNTSILLDNEVSDKNSDKAISKKSKDFKAPAKYVESALNYKLGLGNSVTSGTEGTDASEVNATESFVITDFEIFDRLLTLMNNQIYSIMNKSKELLACIKKAHNTILRQKQISALVSILVKQKVDDKPKYPNISSQYDEAMKRVEMNALVRMFSACLNIEDSDIDLEREELLSENRQGFVGFYVILNKKAQAEEVIKSVQIGFNARKSCLDVFVESASQYASVKPLGGTNFQLDEAKITRLLGPEVFEKLESMSEGTCSVEPIKLNASDKWAVLYLESKGPLKITEQDIKQYAALKKASLIMNKYKAEMLKNGEILFLINDFYDYADLDAKMSDIALKVGEYDITVSDLHKLLESFLPTDKHLHEIILSYQYQYRRPAVNYFFKAARDIALTTSIKTIIAKEEKLPDLHIKLYNLYLAIEKSTQTEPVFYKHLRDEILLNEDEVKAKFFEKIKTMPKTKIKGRYITVESKKIADKIFNSLISNEREKLIPSSKKIDQIFEEYSIDNNSSFDDRIVDFKKIFGEDQNSDSSELVFKPNTFYLYMNTDKYYVIYVTSVYEQDATYNELRSSLIDELIRVKEAEILTKITCTR